MGKKNGKICRSAKTGKYVTPKYAKDHPNTTVRETPPSRRTKKGK